MKNSEATPHPPDKPLNEEYTAENINLEENNVIDSQKNSDEAKPDKKTNGSDNEEGEELEEEDESLVEINEAEYHKLVYAKKIADEEVKLARADALNFRKRVEKEKNSFLEYAQANVLSKFLPVSDDLQRLLENGSGKIEEVHYKAIESLEQKIKTIYKAEGVNVIKIKKGKTAFDPKYHEAIFALPTGEYSPNIIVDVTSTGFIVGERVLRPAKVVISKPEEDTKKSVEEKKEKE